jgi:hypothetical protein
VSVRRLFPYIAVTVIYTLTPLGAELTEHLLHLMTTGHLAHALDHVEHTPDTPEHGCAGPFHICRCHHAPSVVVLLPCTAPAVPQCCSSRPGEPRDGPADGHLQRVFRPPRLG